MPSFRWIVVTVVFACGGRTELGTTTQAPRDASIDDATAPTDFKVAFPDAVSPSGAHVWHSRDGSITDLAFDKNGAFSRDGQQMGSAQSGSAFMLDGNGNEVWSLKVPSLDVLAAQPRDGDRLVVEGYPSNGPPIPVIATLDSDGVLQQIGSNVIDAASYGPDGSTLVFIELADDGSRLETMHDDGSLRTIWMTTQRPLHSPSLSYDQRRIVYTTLDGTAAALAVFDCVSLASTTLLQSNTEMYFSPSFTPDGSAIVFVAGTNGSDSIVRLDLASMTRTVLVNGDTSAFSAGISLARD